MQTHRFRPTHKLQSEFVSKTIRVKILKKEGRRIIFSFISEDKHYEHRIKWRELYPMRAGGYKHCYHDIQEGREYEITIKGVWYKCKEIKNPLGR